VTAAAQVGDGWRHACALSDIPATVPHHVDVAGIPIAIARAEGELYAIYDVCSHENIALSEGEIEGRTIECWLHGSCFDLASGQPTNLPATQSVPVYPVMVDGSGDDAAVYVDLSAAG